VGGDSCDEAPDGVTYLALGEEGDVGGHDHDHDSPPDASQEYAARPQPSVPDAAPQWATTKGTPSLEDFKGERDDPVRIRVLKSTWMTAVEGDPESEDRLKRKPWQELHNATEMDCFRAYWTMEMENLIMEAMKLYPDRVRARPRPYWVRPSMRHPPASLDGNTTRQELRKAMSIT
jgi:hypothetical protein